LLQVDDLRVHYPIRAGLLRRTVATVRAVDGVSLSLQAGRTLALVGESGCGKSTLGKALMRLTPVASGQVLVDGKDVSRLANGRVLSERDHVLLHQLFDGHRVIESRIHGALIRIKRIPKAHAQDVGMADDANQLIAADDWHMVHAIFLDELANFRNRIAVMDGDKIG
jgi:ABC-type oligopeptide transport system ATPase subunit